MMNANSEVNASVVQDWEDLIDRWDTDIKLVPFEREPTPPISFAKDDDLPFREDEDIDPEKSKKLHGMVTYTLRSLGNDYSNSSIETAYGWNGVLLRGKSPDAARNSPSEIDVESQNDVKKKTVQESLLSCGDSKSDCEVLKMHIDTSFDNVTMKSGRGKDNIPSGKSASGSSPVRQPVGDHAGVRAVDAAIQFSQKDMATIARRVRRNTAMSSIMAGLMIHHSSDEEKEKPAQRTFPNVNISVPVEKKTLTLRERPQQIINKENKESSEFQTDACDRTASISLLSSQCRSVQNNLNIFNTNISVPAEQSSPDESTDVRATAKSSDQIIKKKITLSTVTPKTTPQKLSADEIYKNYMDKLSAANPASAPDYPTDASNRRSTVRPKGLNLFDVVEEAFEKKKRSKQ